MSRLEDIKGNSPETKVSREDKIRILKGMAGGDMLPMPEIDDIFEVRVMEDLKLNKKGTGFVPIVVQPIITPDNQERMINGYGLTNGHEYKMFLPRGGIMLVLDYINKINSDLKNAVIQLKGAEWKTDRIDVDRDLQGRAKVCNIIKIWIYEDKNQMTMDDVEKQLSGKGGE